MFFKEKCKFYLKIKKKRIKEYFNPILEKE